MTPPPSSDLPRAVPAVGRRRILGVAGGLAVAGVAVAARGSALAPGAAADSAADSAVRVRIGGRWYAERAVLEWEARRIPVAAAKLRGNAVGAVLRDLDALVLRRAPEIRGIERARRRLLEAKLAMGQQAILEVLGPEVRLSETLAGPPAAVERWSISQTVLASDRGTAAGFVQWYRAMVARNRLADGLIACPDHFRLATRPDGRQTVVEVTGGATVATRFVVDYADRAHVAVPDDPRYPRRIVGSAHGVSRVVGSVSHQARDRPRGFELSLNVAFPALLPPWYPTEHRWHLACEFSRWVAAYLAEDI